MQVVESNIDWWNDLLSDIDNNVNLLDSYISNNILESEDTTNELTSNDKPNVLDSNDKPNIVSSDIKNTTNLESSIKNYIPDILYSNNDNMIENTALVLRPEINQVFTWLANKTAEKLNALNDRLGALDTLNTADKSNVVNAINELVQSLSVTDNNISKNYKTSTAIANDIATAIADVKSEILWDENLAEELNSIKEVIDAFKNADSDLTGLITTLQGYVNAPLTILENLSESDIETFKGMCGWLSEAEVDARATIQADARIDARVGTVALVDASALLAEATPNI